MKAKEVVAEMWSALITDNDLNVIEKYVHSEYKQHSPFVKDGPEGLKEFLAGLRSDYRYELIRLISDDDFVVMHGIHHNMLNNLMTGGETVVGVDMFRVVDNQIVEHWDVSIPQAPASISRRSQVDGETEIKNQELTEISKKIGEQYVTEILINRNLNKLDQSVHPNIIQHNPSIRDGIKALKKALKNDEKEYIKIHRIVAEGEFVAIQSEGAIREQIHTFWDILRIDVNRLIVEQWEVVAVFPGNAEHSNGPF